MPNISVGTRRDEAIRKLEPARDERYKWFAPSRFVGYARRPHAIPSLFTERLTWFAQDVMPAFKRA